MEKLIVITMTLIVLMVTVTTVDALSIDTQKNIETILRK